MIYESHFWHPTVTVFQPWQTKIINYLYVECYQYKIRSKEVHSYLKQVHPDVKISRASVINFLNGLHCAGYIDCETGHGQGGEHFKYTSVLTLGEFKAKLLAELTKKLQDDIGRVK